MFLLLVLLLPALLFVALLVAHVRETRETRIAQRRLSQQIANIAGLLLAAGFKPPSAPHWMDDWHKTHLR